MVTNQTKIQSVIRPRISLTNQEADLINKAKYYAKQNTSTFCAKAAVDRARRVIKKHQEEDLGVEEVFTDE